MNTSIDKLLLNPKPKAIKKDNIHRNQITYMRYYNWIRDLAISLFEWVNLPEGCNSRYLEQKLFTTGSACFFYDDVLEKYLTLGYTNQGNLDVYGEPTGIRAIGQNGYSKYLNTDERVIIYNNSIKQGDLYVAEYYARTIWEIKRSLDINVSTQKYPFFISAPESQVNVVKNLMKKVGENEVVIFANDKFKDFNNLEILNLDNKFVALELQELYKQIIAEVVEYFGVNSVSDKKERMIVTEVMNGIGMTEANRQIRLKTRKEACKEINKKFGLNVDVKFRDDVDMYEQMLKLELVTQYQPQQIDNIRVVE